MKNILKGEAQLKEKKGVRTLRALPFMLDAPWLITVPILEI